MVPPPAATKARRVERPSTATGELTFSSVMRLLTGSHAAATTRGRSPVGEGPDRIAHRLLIAAERAGDGGHVLAAGTGQHDLGTA